MTKNMKDISALDEHWLRKFADETAARDKAERERDELSRTVAACVEHIDVVERILGDHEEEGGVFIPRADLPKRFSHRDGDYLAVTHTVSAGTYAKRVDERDAAIRERDELGIQLEALRERMRLAMDVVHAARDAFSCLAEISVSDVPPYALSHNETAHLEQAGDILHAALAAFDAVPGDEKGGQSV